MADATAKFLAGLPVRGTALESHSNNAAWITHATDLDRAWERLEKQQLSKIRPWAPQYLAPAYEENGPMFYMFSGPDFLYANAFFPNASTYILCGIEPVGPVPDIDKIPRPILFSALANLRKSLDSVLSFSFFITKNMKVDLKQTQLNGTLPVLYVFLARAGCTIDSVTPVALDRAGSFVPEGKGTTSGVKIVFFGPTGREQTLYYFTTRPGGLGCEGEPRFLEVLRAARPGSDAAQGRLIPHAFQQFLAGARLSSHSQQDHSPGRFRNPFSLFRRGQMEPPPYRTLHRADQIGFWNMDSWT